MIESLRVPFEYGYMLKAMGVSALIGGVCALLSCFVTLKGWSLMGDALSHAVVPGVVIAHLLGLPLAGGAFISGLLASVGMGFIRTRTPLKEDAVIGVVFTTFFALGLFLISLNPSGVNLRTIIFGNMLGISDDDLRQVIAIAVGCVVVLALKWRDLVLFCFDPGQAQALGLPVRFLHFLLLGLLSAMAVAAMQTAGALLVVAMLITPGATAYLLTDRFAPMLGLAAVFGAGSGFLGAYASYFFNGSTGGCIVVLQTVCFLCALLFAPKHGMLAGRARRRLAATLTS